MSLANTLLDQLRNPKGRFGRFILSDMNRRHSSLTDWGLAHVSVARNAAVLDVGCGGGRTIDKLAAMTPDGKVCGADPAEASLAASRKTNRRWIERGRVEIRPDPVSRLSFPADTFDLVTAVETHYYWPDLPADLEEILRVLKPGGTLVLVAEAYKGGKHDRATQKLAEAMRRASITFSNLSVDEHRALLAAAGYADVQVDEDHGKGWLCATGRKPAL